MRISDDGQTWYECPDDLFERMVDEESVECFVDMSDDQGVCIVQLSLFRSLRKEAVRKEMMGPMPGEPWKMPTELYGIPIIVEDGR